MKDSDLPSDDVRGVVDIAAIRERLLTWNLAVVSAVGLLSLVLSTNSVLSQGVFVRLIPFWVIYGALLTLAVWRGLPYRLRADGLLALLWVAAGSVLLLFGEPGGGRVLLMLIVVLAAALRGTGATVFWLVVSVLTLLAAGFARTQAWVEAPPPVLDHRWPVWIAYAGGIVFTGVPSGVTVALLLRRLEDGLDTERALVVRLRTEIDRAVAATRAGEVATTSRVRAERALTEREEALQAVAFAAQTLLHAHTWQEVTPAILARVGRALGATRLSIVQLVADDGRMVAPTAYAWTATGTAESLSVDMADVGLGDIVDALIVGQAAPVYRGDLSPAGVKFLDRFGAQALLMSPVMAEGRTWGFVAAFKGDPAPWPDATLEALGAVAGTLGAAMVRDRARVEMLRLNESLERRVAERTEGLAQANAQLEAFAHSVSHDLRAPLRHVDGYAGLLREHLGPVLDAEGERLLGVIEASTRRMMEMIDGLLSFSRLGRAPLVLESVDMAALVDEARAALEVELVGRTIAWQIDPLPVVRADRVLMRQVLVNLLSNAIKYTRRTAVARVRVTASHEDGFWRFAVQDNGVGFDPAGSERLFTVFQRLHSDPQFEGAGVGLAIVRRVVHRHGGEVWATGRPGEGATIGFSLPSAQ